MADIADGNGDSIAEARAPFFGSRSPRGETTWVISLFVILNVATFVVTMGLNDCTRNSHEICSMKFLGRFSFQPFSENPFLGPAPQTLVKLGALERNLITVQRQRWRLLTSSWLHAGLIHLILDLISVVFVGIRLEQAFGPLRVAVIYLVSSFLGNLLSAVFIQHSPSVGSSGALFGLLGAVVSDLVRNWQIYYNKTAAIFLLLFIGAINFILGVLPHVDNFSNIGGFLSGILLGFMLLFSPQLGKQRKGLYDFSMKRPIELKQKLDKPRLRIASLIIACLIFGGCLMAVIHDVNGNKFCQLCHYIDCIPIRGWRCNEQDNSCEAVIYGGSLTLTCLNNHHFHFFPFADISQERMRYICSQICSINS